MSDKQLSLMSNEYFCMENVKYTTRTDEYLVHG
jgi:hypothetical protein